MDVTAVVPVYNEERTIKKVLEVLLSCPRIGKLIVIDSGSTDKTSAILKGFKGKKISILRQKRPEGKGNAVVFGTKNIKSDIILFFDADLIGLTGEHIEKLLYPVLNEGVSMVIGLRDKGSLIGNMIMPYFPLTGGERAILTKVFMEIRKCPLVAGWGLESVMNDYCRKKKLKVAKVRLTGMDHIGIQTKKFGLMAFLKEIYDVIVTKVKLLGVSYD